MVNNMSYEDWRRLKPSSKAISKACLDFGDSAECAKKKIQDLDGFKGVGAYWEGNRMHFLTEEIHPKIVAPERPRVMLLFSNPHPDSVCKGLFMSEKRSRKFWGMPPFSSKFGIDHDFCWDKKGIQEIVSSLFKGAYKGPLLFFDCFYQIPSRSPKDLRKLFKTKTRNFDCYLHRPSLKRIGTILDSYNIKTVLVFTIETFESITDKPSIPKCSREILCSLVKERLCTGDKKNFWRKMKNNKLMKQVVLPNLKHDCVAIKVMDTRAKYWKANGQSVFSCVLDYALEYAEDLPKSI